MTDTGALPGAILGAIPVAPLGALSAAVTGATLGLTLIVAIGAQNAFVLRQGLKREHALERMLGYFQ